MILSDLSLLTIQKSMDNPPALTVVSGSLYQLLLARLVKKSLRCTQLVDPFPGSSLLCLLILCPRPDCSKELHRGSDPIG